MVTKHNLRFLGNREKWVFPPPYYFPSQLNSQIKKYELSIPFIKNPKKKSKIIFFFIYFHSIHFSPPKRWIRSNPVVNFTTFEVSVIRAPLFIKYQIKSIWISCIPNAPPFVGFEPVFKQSAEQILTLLSSNSKSTWRWDTFPFKQMHNFE